jgi:hypothetical protein
MQEELEPEGSIKIGGTMDDGDQAVVELLS